MTNFNTKEEISLGKNYKLFLNKKLGNGAFGDLYRGENISTKKPIAIKCEKVKEDHLSLLKTEISILNFLQGGIGIPKIYEFISSPKYNFMIFELLNLNLDGLFELCKKIFNRNNFKFGLTDVNYVIGLAKRFMDKRNGIQKPYKDRKKITGTLTYASI